MIRLGIIAGVLLLGILLAIAAIPNFTSHVHDPRHECLANLRQLDGATLEWSIDNRKTNGEIPTVEDLRFYFSGYRKFPICPSGGKYTLGNYSNFPTCSQPGHKLD
jgi:hypothetical protein